MNDNLTPDEINGFKSMGQLKPGQSATALATSNSTIDSFLKGFQTSSGAIGNLLQGGAKGVESTLMGAGEIGQSIADNTAGRLVSASQGKGFVPTGQGIDSTQLFTPGSEGNQQMKDSYHAQGLLQNVGFGAEKIGEFLAPGGAEKGVYEKGASYINKLPDLLGIAGKGAKALTGTLNAALRGITSGTSFGGVTAVQTGGDPNKTKGAAEVGALAGPLSSALETFGPGLYESLAKSDFRLSPAVEAKAAKTADKSASFVSSNKITGTAATKYAKLNTITSKFESMLQSNLPRGIAVQKDSIIDDINTNVEQLKQSDPSIYEKARAQADQAVKLLSNGEGNIMSVDDALAAKRSWGAQAFKLSKKSKADPTEVQEGAYAAEQAFQRALNGAFERSGEEIKVPPALRSMFGGQESVSLSEFNDVYSGAISAKNLTYTAQFKNDPSLFGRLFALWSGEIVGQSIAPGPAGKLIGGGLGELVSGKLPAGLRNLGERALGNPEFPETTAKIGQAIGNSAEAQSDTGQ